MEQLLGWQQKIMCDTHNPEIFRQQTQWQMNKSLRKELKSFYTWWNYDDHYFSSDKNISLIWQNYNFDQKWWYFSFSYFFYFWFPHHWLIDGSKKHDGLQRQSFITFLEFLENSIFREIYFEILKLKIWILFLEI